MIQNRFSILLVDDWTSILEGLISGFEGALILVDESALRQYTENGLTPFLDCINSNNYSGIFIKTCNSYGNTINEIRNSRTSDDSSFDFIILDVNLGISGDEVEGGIKILNSEIRPHKSKEFHPTCIVYSGHPDAKKTLEVILGFGKDYLPDDIKLVVKSGTETESLLKETIGYISKGLTKLQQEKYLSCLDYDGCNCAIEKISKIINVLSGILEKKSELKVEDLKNAETQIGQFLAQIERLQITKTGLSITCGTFPEPMLKIRRLLNSCSSLIKNNNVNPLTENFVKNVEETRKLASDLRSTLRPPILKAAKEFYSHASSIRLVAGGLDFKHALNSVKGLTKRISSYLNNPSRTSLKELKASLRSFYSLFDLFKKGIVELREKTPSSDLNVLGTKFKELLDLDPENSLNNIKNEIASLLKKGDKDFSSTLSDFSERHSQILNLILDTHEEFDNIFRIPLIIRNDVCFNVFEGYKIELPDEKDFPLLTRKFDGESVGCFPCIPDQIRRLACNLLTNSFQHGKREGVQVTVEFSLNKEENEMTVTFSDNGEGLRNINYMELVNFSFIANPKKGVPEVIKICRDHGAKLVVKTRNFGFDFNLQKKLSDVKDRFDGTSFSIYFKCFKD